MLQPLLVIIYLAFISLGLPDSLLGAAWPDMYREFLVPVSYAGGVSMIIAAGTVFSSLQSDRMTKKAGTGKVTAFSVLLTAAALLGFSLSRSYAELCFWAIPYGLGAGCIDAALNNYVALHYAGRHMSWLHCMWGVGASLGPRVMSAALSGGQGWNMGYRRVALIQFALTAVLFLSLPLWRERRAPSAGSGAAKEARGEALPLPQVLRIPGAKAAMLSFFCYCALEQTAGLWAGSYFALRWNVPAEAAAGAAGLFFIGITAGRALGGFLTLRRSDAQMIRLGQGIIACGIVLLLLPLGAGVSAAGIVLTGLGCAPVYPSMLHSTPERFGAERSQAVIGVQMASAYVGTCFMPPIFGLIAGRAGISLLPLYLLVILVLMVLMNEKNTASRRGPSGRVPRRTDGEPGA